jgi:hypothetical protein
MEKNKPAVPSIDQLAAWSPTFYGTGSFVERSIHLGTIERSQSWFHENPSSRTGPCRQVSHPISDPAIIFDKLFGKFMPQAAPKQPTTPATPASDRKLIVDYVFEAYRALRDSNRRLSAEDRRRLGAHMEFLAEMQRKVSASAGLVGAAAGCSKPQRPGPVTMPDKGPSVGTYRSPTQSIKLYDTLTDILAAAFRCGLTRVATIDASDYFDTFSTFGGDWHGAAHKTRSDPEAERAHVEGHRNFFEHVMLHLANKLAVEEVPGATYLDNTILVFNSEASGISHTQADKPVITLGNVGGYFKTGFYVDYQNMRPESIMDKKGTPDQANTGLLIHQFWANLLYALKIPRSEWERYGEPGRGYGPQILGDFDGHAFTSAHYVRSVLDRAGDKLPIIT